MNAVSMPRVDVEAVVITHLRQHLADRGYPDSDLHTLRDLAIRCANAAFRAIPTRPRTWILPAPPPVINPELEAGVERLRQAVLAGDDLTPFQSTRRLNADFHDHLLTDWGIHHFHLGLGQHATLPQFVERTGPVLFAYVTATEVLVLGIDEHGAWEDPELLEVLHAHWPQHLARYRALGPVAGALTTAAEVKAFRKSGINGAVRLRDGTTYASLNVGRTTNGTPVITVLHANHLAQTVRQLQAHIDRQLATMIDIIVTKRGVAPEAIQFQLAMVRHGEDRAAGFYLDDLTTGYSFFLQEAPAPIQGPTP